MDKYENETESDGPLFSFWIAPGDEDARVLLQGIEEVFNNTLKQYDIYLSERVDGLNEKNLSMDFRLFGSPEEMNAFPPGDNIPDLQCTVKSDAGHSDKCKIELVYNSLLTGHQTIIIQDKNSLIYIIEDMISSIIFPGLIGFDYADFSNILSNSSNIVAHCIINNNFAQDMELLGLVKEQEYNIIVLFSFGSRNKNFIEEISQWVASNYDDNIFDLVYYSCILRNNEQEEIDRRSIFIGRTIGGSDGHL